MLKLHGEQSKYRSWKPWSPWRWYQQKRWWKWWTQYFAAEEISLGEGREEVADAGREEEEEIGKVSKDNAFWNGQGCDTSCFVFWGWCWRQLFDFWIFIKHKPGGAWAQGREDSTKFEIWGRIQRRSLSEVTHVCGAEELEEYEQEFIEVGDE